MDNIKTIFSIIMIVAFGAIGVFLCMGKCSFLLGSVRNMEPGSKKTIITRIFGIILLVITVFLTIAIFCK